MYFFLLIIFLIPFIYFIVSIEYIIYIITQILYQRTVYVNASTILYQQLCFWGVKSFKWIFDCVWGWQSWFPYPCIVQGSTVYQVILQTNTVISYVCYISIKICDTVQQTFFTKRQTLNILRFADYIESLSQGCSSATAVQKQPQAICK